MKLVHALIAKSIAETILVATLAVVFYFTTFPPYFHGWGEANSHAISGWVVNDSAPAERVEMQLFVDGKFVASGAADLPRPDIVAAGWAKDERHGYTFEVTSVPAGVHEARVYARHSSGRMKRQTLQLVGDPITFEVSENGTLRDLSKHVPSISPR